MTMTGDRPLEDIETLSLGEFTYTQAEIYTYCELVADKNPFHWRGKAPLNLTLGTITGRLFQWGIKQGMKMAAITEQCCQMRQPVKENHIYRLHAWVEHLGDKLANIYFEVYDVIDPPNPQTVVMSGHIQVRHT